MMLFIAVGILLIVLHKRGELGPFRWEGRPVTAGRCGRVGAIGAPAERAMPTGGPHQAHPRGPRHDASPETVLAQRLADGEITADEYLERVAVLTDR